LIGKQYYLEMSISRFALSPEDESLTDPMMDTACSVDDMTLTTTNIDRTSSTIVRGEIHILLHPTYNVWRYYIANSVDLLETGTLPVHSNSRFVRTRSPVAILGGSV
jgi:hypothetical protein